MPISSTRAGAPTVLRRRRSTSTEEDVRRGLSPRRPRSFETNADSAPDAARRRGRDRVFMGPVVRIRAERAVWIEGVGGQESGRGVALVEQVRDAGEHIDPLG